MPWRRRPRAALLLLLGASALIAAVAALRAPTSPPTINDTLTRDHAGCAGIDTLVWHPLSGVEYTGRLRLTLPAQWGGAMAAYVGDSWPLDLEASTDRGLPVAFSAERLLAGPGVHLPPDYWLDDGSPADAPRHVTRLQIDASGAEDRTVTLSLGRRAPRVLARLINYPSDVRAPVCAEPLGRDEVYFGSGWAGQERDAREGPVRWMGAYGAVMVAAKHGESVRIRARLAPAIASDARETTALILRINDVLELAPVVLTPGFQDHEWTVPDTAWVPGTNEILFKVSRTSMSGTRTRGLALASLHVD